METLQLLLTLILSGMMSVSYAQTMSSDETLTKMQKVINYAEAGNQEVVRIEADIIQDEQSQFIAKNPV